MDISETNLPIEFINDLFEELCYQVVYNTVPTNTGKISGKVTFDLNKDCIAKSSDPTLGKWLVALSSDSRTYYRVTDENGTYSFGLPEEHIPSDYFPKTNCGMYAMTLSKLI